LPSGRHPARPSGQPDCDCCRVAGGHCAAAAGAGRFGPSSRVGRSEFGVWGWIVRACHAAPEGASPAGALRSSGPGCAVAQPGATTRRACAPPTAGAYHGALLCPACQQRGSADSCWPTRASQAPARVRALPAQRPATLPARPAGPSAGTITVTLDTGGGSRRMASVWQLSSVRAPSAGSRHCRQPCPTVTLLWFREIKQQMTGCLG